MAKLLECALEDACVRRALDNGWMSWKMNGMGHNSWPDRLFIAPDGAPIWVEFKRKGEELTPRQLAMHRRLSQQNCVVLVIDNEQDFYYWVLRRGGREAE